MSRWSFWIDRGGTFTDVVARRPDGAVQARKFLSHNPQVYAEAVTHGIRDFLGLAPEEALPTAQIDAVRIGSTVATNTLLQRTGEITGLAITRGFADALLIGRQQRPELFRREIRRPPPLYRQVAEIRGRIGADAEEVEPLDEEEARRTLQRMRSSGVRALAIALMHSFRNPRHEKRVEEIARQIGFEQVFASHRVAGLIGLLRRADTAVADAYLTPALHAWRDGIARCFDAPPAPGQLLFMDSGGGLAPAENFSGRNAVLSGPAGGVVAAARICRQAGLQRCIAFDMGGTSTDVSLYGGAYERSLDTRVDGVHFAVPMMRIHTVAAGGSSVLHDEEHRLRVGPDSAGADPGPLCYRRGGPLCLSDAQLMLGVLQPEYFPAIFGENGRQPLDREAVQKRFQQWSAARSCTAEQLAEDFVEVAVAEMVRAVRRITVERGLEPARYALCNFGAASGQYVCRLAESLGINDILVHPLAGALSAWGIGLAPVHGSRECSVEQTLDERRLMEVGARARELLAEIETDLRARHASLGETVAEIHLQLKYRGADAGIEIPWSPSLGEGNAAGTGNAERVEKKNAAGAGNAEGVEEGNAAGTGNTEGVEEENAAGERNGTGERDGVREENAAGEGNGTGERDGAREENGARERDRAGMVTRVREGDEAGEEKGVEQLRRRFEELHRRRFGFLTPETEIRIAALLVEVRTREEECAAMDEAPPLQADAPAIPPDAKARVFMDGAWSEVPLLSRAALQQGDVVSGPALLIEELATLLLRPGWEMRAQADGLLRLQRSAARNAARNAEKNAAVNPPRQASARKADPALREIFNHRFMSIAEQMGVALQNSARSLNIRERMDFSCALFDDQGRLIANAPHIPVHLGSMGDSVRAMIRKYKTDLRAGDAWVLNDPYLGGTHLPDLTVISPVFASDREAPHFFVASRGHHADIGGLTPGSMPANSGNISEEGVLFDGFRLVRDGDFSEAALRERLCAGDWPARNPEQNIADLRAQLEACRLGERQLLQLVEEHGLRTVSAYMRHLRTAAAQAVQRVLESLPDGECRVEMDNGAWVSAAIRVDRKALRAELDFSGSAPQRRDNFNAPAAITRAAVLYVFRTLVDEEIPLNDGCLAPLRLKIPRGTLLNPRTPAAVVAGNVETSQIVVDALFGALGLQAASQGTMNNFSCGDAQYQYYETLGGGAGAGADFDGASAVHTHMTNSRLTDPEVLESSLPLRVEACAVRPGSGGAGRHAGGDGMHRTLLFLTPMQVSLLGNRRRTRPFGLQGGADGEAGKNILLRADGRREELPSAVCIDVRPGDRIRVLTPGGGGFGTAGTTAKRSRS